MGIFDSIKAAFGYVHAPMPAPNAQDYARRAALLQFQTMPANDIAGRGVLVSQNNIWGAKYWRISQPPQIYAHHTGVIDSLVGGGTVASGLYGTPLVPNPDQNGMG